MIRDAITYGGKDAFFAEHLRYMEDNYMQSSACFLAIPWHYIVETRIRWQQKIDYFERVISLLKKLQLEDTNVKYAMVLFQSNIKQIMKLALDLKLTSSLYSLYPIFRNMLLYNSRGDDIIPSIAIPLLPTKHLLYREPTKNIKRTVFFAGKCTHPLRCLIGQIPKYPGWEIEPCYFCQGGKDLTCKSTLSYSSYKEKMQNNLFILSPVGTFRNSFRLTEAIQLGRIPIVVFTTNYKYYHTCSTFSFGCCQEQVRHFSQRKSSIYQQHLLSSEDLLYRWRTHMGVWLPFRDRIDWSKAAIFIEDTELYNIGNIVRSLSDEEIDMRLQYISQISHMFNIEFVRSYILQGHRHTGNFDVPFARKTSSNTFTLVNSYSYLILEEHRKEIILCIVANLENADIQSVLVVYDSHDKTHNCNTFLNTLDHMGANVFKLNCIHTHQGQPNYYEMLQYAMNAPTDIAILSNADMVFDDSINKARSIRSNNIVTMSVTGGVLESPRDLRNVYLSHVSYIPNRNPGKCLDTGMHPYHSWPDKLFSIDAFIMKTGQYLNPSVFKNSAGKFYKMNTMGGELATAGALFQLGYRVTNACKHINAFHWHESIKTHPSVKESRLYAPFGIYDEKYLKKPMSKKSVFRNIHTSEARTMYHLPHGCELLDECLH